MLKEICKGDSIREYNQLICVSWGIPFCCKSSYCVPHALGLTTATQIFAKSKMHATFMSLRRINGLISYRNGSFLVKFTVCGPLYFILIFRTILYSEKWSVSCLIISVVGRNYTSQHIHDRSARTTKPH